MRRTLCGITLALCSLLQLRAQPAVVSAAEPNPASEIPSLIHFSGAVGLSETSEAAWSKDEPVSINFALYSDAQGGSPVWIETQSVKPDKTGHYTINLGSTTQGLPRALFSSGQARWLGIQPTGEAEQPRVLLVAVPYALKAADAETLGGLKPSDFQLAQTATGSAIPVAAPGSRPTAAATSAAVTGAGTAGYLPLWSSASNLVNSGLFQKAGNIGIGTVSPATPFDLYGKAALRDTLLLYPKGTDASLLISGTRFSIDSLGKVNFIPGQLFPGTGTLTGITTVATSGLQGGTTKGNPNLAIKAAGVTNAMLQHPSFTVPVTAPLAGGGLVSLGGTATAISLKPCPAGQTLVSNGTTWSCATSSASAGVSSVGLSAPASDFKVTGSPVTSTGTLGLSWIIPPTSADFNNAIVKRDALGDISAHTITAEGNVLAKTDLLVTGNIITGSSIGVGIAAPAAEVNLNAFGSANADTLLIGSKGRGMQLRDTGVGVDIESFGVPLYMNQNSTQPTYFGTQTYFSKAVGIGTSTPEATLNVNDAGGSGNSLLVGNGGSKGLRMRDDGSGVDFESIGVPLYVNFTTKQPIILNPIRNPNPDPNVASSASVLIGSTDTGLGYGFNGNESPVLAVGAFTDSNGKRYSAYFSDEVVLGTNLRVLGHKDFSIPHPLDPEHKLLDHAAIESSEVLNEYSGNAVLDAKGEARVDFPEWFSAININFRYQLTAVGAPGPNLYVSEEINGNHFGIAGGKPGSKVSWQVTATRNDEYMREHPFQLETDKPQRPAGK